MGEGCFAPLKAHFCAFRAVGQTERLQSCSLVRVPGQGSEASLAMGGTFTHTALERGGDDATHNHQQREVQEMARDPHPIQNTRSGSSSVLAAI